MGVGLERARILLENQEVRIGNLFSGGIMPIPRIRRFVSWLGKPGDRGVKWDRLILLSERTLDFGDK